MAPPTDSTQTSTPLLPVNFLTCLDQFSPVSRTVCAHQLNRTIEFPLMPRGDDGSATKMVGYVERRQSESATDPGIRTHWPAVRDARVSIMRHAVRWVSP